MSTDSFKFQFDRSLEYEKLKEWLKEIQPYEFHSDADYTLLLDHSRRQLEYATDLHSVVEAKADSMLTYLGAGIAGTAALLEFTNTPWTSWMWIPFGAAAISAMFALIARHPQTMPDTASTRELAEYHRRVTNEGQRQFYLAASHHWATVEMKSLTKFRASHLSHAIRLAIAAAILMVICAVSSPARPSDSSQQVPQRSALRPLPLAPARSLAEPEGEADSLVVRTAAKSRTFDAP